MIDHNSCLFVSILNPISALSFLSIVLTYLLNFALLLPVTAADEFENGFFNLASKSSVTSNLYGNISQLSNA